MSKDFFDFNKYDYLFFDFDGVILDSEYIKIEGFKRIYQRYGKGVADEVVRQEQIDSGKSRFEKFKLYHKKFLGIDLTQKDIKRLAREYSEIVLSKVLKARYIEGAPEFLKIARENKKSCFLVSATPEEEIKRIARLKKLKKYFKDIKGSPQSKEKNIKDLIKKYRIDRRKAIFFGDSLSDRRAANCNNLRFIGINSHSGSVNYKTFNELFKKRTQ